MWLLKRMLYPNEVMDCDASGAIMVVGDYYYENTETGEKILATYWQKKKLQQLKDDNPLQDLIEQAKDDKKEKQDAKKEKQEELSDLMLDDTKFNRYDYQNIDDNSINNDMTWSFRMDPVEQTTYDGRRYYGERRYYDNDRHHARLEGDFKTNHELNTFRNNP